MRQQASFCRAKIRHSVRKFQLFACFNTLITLFAFKSSIIGLYYIGERLILRKFYPDLQIFDLLLLRFHFLAYFSTVKLKDMSKIIGGIFTVIGFILAAVNIMLYMNSSAYFDYTPIATTPYVDATKHLSLFETGLGAPMIITFLMLSIGLTFLFVSKEPNLK